MKVKLITMTPDPIDVMWVAARTCYSAESPIDMWDNLNPDVPANICDYAGNFQEDQRESHWKLVKTVLNSGHQSIAEHVYFTFAIEGISRACSHQLVRHRAGIVFSQQSQRYVEIKEDIGVLEGRNFTPDTFKDEKDIITILDKYFIWDHECYAQAYSLIQALYCYLYQVREGIKPEDARNVLPNATKTNLTMSINYRELIHICNLRLCTRAQKEIRDLFKLIKEEVNNQDERLSSLLAPSCEVHGFCKEHKCCGRKPKIEDVFEGYERYKGLED